MEQRSSYLTATPLRATWLLGVFAGLAGLLAVMGTYAVSTCFAAQKAREIAIRIAVGADSWSVTKAVCRKPMGSIAIGVAGGLLGSLALTRLLTSLLFGVSALDALTYLTAAMILFVSACLAVLRPTIQLLSLDVTGTLRKE